MGCLFFSKPQQSLQYNYFLERHPINPDEPIVSPTHDSPLTTHNCFHLRHIIFDTIGFLGCMANFSVKDWYNWIKLTFSRGIKQT
jgi:hypothetical protein